MCLCYWYMYIYHNYNYSQCDVFLHVLVGNSGKGIDEIHNTRGTTLLAPNYSSKSPSPPLSYLAAHPTWCAVMQEWYAERVPAVHT